MNVKLKLQYLKNKRLFYQNRTTLIMENSKNIGNVFVLVKNESISIKDVPFDSNYPCFEVKLCYERNTFPIEFPRDLWLIYVSIEKEKPKKLNWNRITNSYQLKRFLGCRFNINKSSFKFNNADKRGEFCTILDEKCQFELRKKSKLKDFKESEQDNKRTIKMINNKIGYYSKRKNFLKEHFGKYICFADGEIKSVSKYTWNSGNFYPDDFTSFETVVGKEDEKIKSEVGLL